MRAARFSPPAGALLLALALGGASAGQQQAPEPQVPGTAGTSQRTSAPRQPSATYVCPVALPGVFLSSEDTADGEAVRFTLRDPTRVAQLRTSVRDFVARSQELGQSHERVYGLVSTPGVSVPVAEAHACAVCPDLPRTMAPPPGLGPGTGMGGAAMEGIRVPPARLRVEDTPDGARIVHAPKDPAQLDALRASVRAWVVQVQTGECPILGGAWR